MQNIYNDAIEKVHRGARFTINFQKRNLKVSGKYLIKEGKFEGDLGIKPCNNPLETITKLYVRYRHSIPSARSDYKRKNYFIALPEHKLEEDDMLYGEPREVAQIKLELYVLIMVLNGSLKWGDFAKDKWFWQSPEHKDLVILKEWIEPNVTNIN